MIKRLLPPQLLPALEASLVALFFVQALRFAIGTYYGRVAGAAVAGVLDPSLTTGVPSPATVSSEVTFLIYMLLLPLLAVVLGRVRALLLVAALVTAIGRLLINTGGMSPAIASALAVGGGLLYFALLIRHRASLFAPAIIVAFTGDQLLRAAGDTLDPSWAALYLPAQLALSALVVLLAFLNLRQRPTDTEEGVSPDRGALSLWGGVGFGGLLFLQVALLALPNAIAGRAGYEYTPLVPLTLLATALPLLPWLRARARDVISLFDPGVRGWVWLLLIALLIILGTRLGGAVAGVVLVIAQLLVSLLWWWVARPAAEKERHLTGLWLVVGVGVFALLATGDFFTYEYAYVRNFSGNLNFLNPFIPPLLRGFRGLGLGVLLLAVFFAALPMTQTLRRVPWAGVAGSRRASFAWLLIVIAITAGGAWLARPPVVTPAQNTDNLRVGTYNIHAGSNEFFASDLPLTAQTIQVSGADVVLLQEVETGRMTSFGVDQALWLARRVGMDRRFYATNEGLQGLAVLSRVPIIFADGVVLPGTGQQTGAQRVQVAPRPDAIVTVYNTWLGVLTASDSDALAAQEQDQTVQLAGLFQLISAHHPGGVLGRTVIGGTFHNVPDSPLLAQMRAAGFEDPFAGLPLQLSATLVRAGVPQVRFDYLWLRNLGRLSAGVLETAASDHRMAVAEVAVE
jgi:endonuclease/exonuclease/phosphatase (EEP) superfamily protein YafD